jgi:hypothetical protein
MPPSGIIKAARRSRSYDGDNETPQAEADAYFLPCFASLRLCLLIVVYGLDLFKQSGVTIVVIGTAVYVSRRTAA